MATTRRKPSEATAAAPPPHTGADSQRLILDTAARLFKEEGWTATSLRDIAGECGIKAGSIYYHFSSKDEIVAEVLRVGVQTTFDQVRQAVEALPVRASTDTVLRTAIRAHLRAMFHLSDYTVANLRIFGQVPPHVRDGHAPLRGEYEAYWSQLFARCAEAGTLDPERDLKLARYFLIGAMNATLDWFHQGRLSIEDIGDELTALFLDGLRQRRRRTRERT